MSVLGLVAGYGRRLLGDRRAGFVKDRLGDHEKCGEEQVAEKGVAEKEQGGREARFTGGQRLPPSRQSFRVGGG